MGDANKKGATIIVGTLWDQIHFPPTHSIVSLKINYFLLLLSISVFRFYGHKTESWKETKSFRLHLQYQYIAIG